VLEEPPNLPAEYRGQFGRVSVERTLPQLRAFAEQGGTIIAIGSSAANLAVHLGLPVGNHLEADGVPLPRTRVYVPGSILEVAVDSTHPAAFGMPGRADVFVDDSPVFRLLPGAEARGARVLAHVATTTPLRSGWAWGQQLLHQGAAAVEVPMGKGRVLLLGPQVTQRAQPHGTFKLLFNPLLASGQ
jgi:hypothetical protein